MVIDLADSPEDIESLVNREGFASTYYLQLYRDNKVIPSAVSADYESEEYRDTVVAGISKIPETRGPVYVHCLEGKDRTGFVCMLLEALAGGSYEEMCRDYMMTYQNYFAVDKDTTRQKYDAIVDLYFDPLLCFLDGKQNIEEAKNEEHSAHAEEYLLAGGMTREEIASLKEMILTE